MAFYRSKKNKCWTVKAVGRATGRTVAWVTGHRDAATFRRPYDKVGHLKECIFYTDDWDAFAKVLPKARHAIGEAHTVAIERDDSNTRHPSWPDDTTHQSGRPLRRPVQCNHQALDLANATPCIPGLSRKNIIYL
ncbi:IS1 family transposase [Methyloglobulus sp.]|uniref:IS1 family transposase n=1 Tax=Methyloglobulus sp. TaxID=2518622 RepID=UPI00398A4EDF